MSGMTGTVIVTKEKALPGYVIDPNAKMKTVTVNPGDTQTLTLFNQTLTVQKFVEGTKTPIPGVTFLITDSAGKLYVFPKNGMGEITIRKIGNEKIRQFP